MHVIAEQRTKNLEQTTVRKDVRSRKGAGHAQRDIVARTPYLKKPIRPRSRRLALHRGQIQRSELRDILLMHGLDCGGRKHSTQQDAAVLIESRMRCGLGLRSNLSVGGLA